MRRAVPWALAVAMLGPGLAVCGGPALNDGPTRPGEWGFRPAPASASPVNPPGFVWRPQRGAVAYELECARDAAFTKAAYRVDGLKLNCHCPSRTFEPGTWYWRFRYKNPKGKLSPWSGARSFTIGNGAVAFPLPTRKELLARIPRQHPRLFVRPEGLPRLRTLAQGELRPQFDQLITSCEKLLKNPPPTDEPPRYPKGIKRRGEEWRKIWWGNRVRTIKVLDGAATLAFTRLLGGKDEYGHLAKRLLLAAAAWDPKGSTSTLYNDEAGMPYAYYFARAYTFANDLLSEEEKAVCRKVMRTRGSQMYWHLCPRHLWYPYESHSNRAWHFLGEVGIAFLGEIPEAADWVWFAMNVFTCVYPVWSDDDGGWHEGSNYWGGYISRFTWWADVMRPATGIDAYRKPYFAKVGTYPIYLMPPGTVGGGFGDLTAHRRSRHNVGVMTNFAVQAQNPHWQWYVEAHAGPRPEGGYVGFVRGALPKVEAKPPTGLPTSRCFRGTGQAALNTTLLDAKDNVEVIFKSSPFGTQSHGYEAQNAFLLYAFGERLLIRTGRRDMYGSVHHRDWMWHTKSVNSITVDGHSQFKRSHEAVGRILAFHTSRHFDYVAGEAGHAYGKALTRFTRHILFVKPELIVVYDLLEAPKPSHFEWRLHAPTKMAIGGQDDIQVVNRKAACRVAFLAPSGLKLSLTDKFDPPPRPRIKLVEWHLTAQTPRPAEQMQFVTVIHPHRVGEQPPPPPVLKKLPNGYALDAPLSDGRVVVLLRAADKGEMSLAGVEADADVTAVRYGKAGKAVRRITVQGGKVQASDL